LDWNKIIQTGETVNPRASASVRTPGVTFGLTYEGVRLAALAVESDRHPRAETSVQQEMTFAGCAPVIIERIVGQGTKREPMFLPLAAN
jgi:hypothetical protein